MVCNVYDYWCAMYMTIGVQCISKNIRFKLEEFSGWCAMYMTIVNPFDSIDKKKVFQI